MAVTELAAGIEQSANHPLAALRVLLLEDSRADALLTEEYLRSVRSDVAVDHVTRLADLGAPQVEMADCALVDLELPDASGLSIVSTLRRLAPTLPIVVLTSLDDVNTVVESLRVGAQDYLVKNHVDGYALERAIRYATQRMMLERRLNHLALHDPLTGLPNRTLFRDRLEQALHRAQRSPAELVVMLLDLDHFKSVNDTLGHAAGDELLVEVARRLTTVLRPSDTLARLGGDEFTLLCEGLSSLTDADVIASRLSTVSQRPFMLRNQRVEIGVSIGMAAVRGVSDLDGALRQADIAMYLAKHSGRGQARWYDPSPENERAHQFPLDSKLRKDVDASVDGGDDFSVVMQPIMNLGTNQPVAVEALARWRDDSGRSIPPAAFIPVAERTSLVVDLDLNVLRLALAELAVRRQEFPSLGLHVNVSSRTLASIGYVERVHELIGETGIDPASLTVEILEHSLLEGAAVLAVRQLREQRISVALDDFGAGCSSLAHLVSLPANILKLDRAFVCAAAGGDRRTKSLVRVITTLARDLQMTVIAEGVETADQLTLLDELGVSLAQGHLWGRP
ncbi:MAG: EAL domain-containing protein [Nocardioidaceae bacterium]|nr:EAL domain-containing protein [Nocardioidaceae bacterium]